MTSRLSLAGVLFDEFELLDGRRATTNKAGYEWQRDAERNPFAAVHGPAC